MRIESFNYVRPRELAEACAVLAEHGPEAKVIAGGSDLLVRMKQGITSPRWVVDLKSVEGLDEVRFDDGALVIGAAATLRSLEKLAQVREMVPALAQAAESVASIQIRNWATLGGNICLETMCWYYNQSRMWKMAHPSCNKAGGATCYVVNKQNECYATYRGDTATALIALGARARLVRRDGERDVLVEDLFSGDGKSPLRVAPDEIVTAVYVPARAEKSSSTYLKMSHRNAVDYPQVGVGVFLSVDDGSDVCRDVRIALGAVGSGPVRARAAEDALRGQALSAEGIGEAASLAIKSAHPINNMAHGSPAYRRKMVGVLTRRALEHVQAKLRGE